MTYRELIEICYNTPEEKCDDCSYKKECEAFRYKTVGEFPTFLYKSLNVDFDAEIEVEE